MLLTFSHAIVDGLYRAKDKKSGKNQLKYHFDQKIQKFHKFVNGGIRFRWHCRNPNIRFRLKPTIRPNIRPQLVFGRPLNACSAFENCQAYGKWNQFQYFQHTPGAGFTNFTKFLMRILLSFYKVAQAPRRTFVGLYQHIPTNSVGESGPRPINVSH
jgi:hypothetical protein